MNGKEKVSNKKFIISIVITIIAALLVCLILVFIFNKDSVLSLFSDVKITDNEVIKTEKYTSDEFNMTIPKGWKVEVGSSNFDRYSYYVFTVYDPLDPTYRLFFNMKTEGYTRTKSDKSKLSYYKSSPFSILPTLDPMTVQNFYNNYSKGMQYFYEDSLSYPDIKNFNVVESFGADPFGGEVVRATYNDENGKVVDGIFTVNLKEVSLYYATVVSAYNAMYYTVPEGELINWQSTLNKCLGSIEFTDHFIDNFNKSQGNLMNTIKANQKVYDEMSDMINEGWNQRQDTYDIISQKQSDATLGYERVYDTKTGDIYKAENGFMDNDWNGRYEKASDDMYNLPTAGYIEIK